MKHFNIEKNITAVTDCPAITFAHLKSRDTPGSHSLHLNDHLEIYIYISGDAHYIVEDNYYTLQKGDILIIPPHCIHVPMLKSTCDYERFYLLLPMRAFKSYFFDPLIDLIIKAKKNGFKLSLDEKRRDEAISLLTKISDLLEKDADEMSTLLAYSHIISFLCMLDTNETHKRSANEKKAAIPALLKDILSYIGKAPEKISSAGDIADTFHISPPYLSSLFKKHVGVTATEYLQTKKIAVAKRLLEEGSSVAYACYESGFCDSSYFIKIFKRCVGITPNKYKNLYSGK